MGQTTSKFAQIVPTTLFSTLPQTEQAFLWRQSERYAFSYQEVRQLVDIAIDRQRWKEAPLAQAWPESDASSVVTDTNSMTSSADSATKLKLQNGPQQRKRLMASLREQHEHLRSSLKSYDGLSMTDKPAASKPKLRVEPQPQLGLGRCPVASSKTRCCNLLTLDAVEKCGFDCSYCSIQSFYHGNEVTFDADFAKKLAALTLDPNKTYHIGTGQSSDSLMWGNHAGLMEALFEFARANPNVVLELKTKSKNIQWMLKQDIPANVVTTWTLNPQTIIDFEEHMSADLASRLGCAEKIAAKGNLVGFHFHPMVQYDHWQCDYQDITKRLLERFEPSQVALISMGTLTFTKSVMKTIRQRDLTSKILQMPMVEVAGKFSYPVDVKTAMFSTLYESLSAWHKSVFFYLCMEPQTLWEPVFGFDYTDNDAFEAAMKGAYFDKINECAANQQGKHFGLAES